MKLKTLILTFESDRQIRENAAKLRGFFATKFNEYVLLHHHICDKFVYKYPLIQYKMISNTPTIIAINEGVEVLKEIYDKSESIRLGNHTYKIFGKSIQIKEQEFGISNKFYIYKFITPWFALNQKNHKIYTELDAEKRKEFLRKILTGNIISMSKGLDYTVNTEIKLDIKVRMMKSSYKRIGISAFKGTFVVNFLIPDYFGVGKAVSRGFGTVKSVKNQVRS